MTNTLFLLPGFLCDQNVWKHQVKAFEGIADITIPCFKGIDSLQGMAQSVLDQAPQHFSIVGHSMGGRVAFELMNLAPERIAKFAVMDTAVHALRPEEPEQRQQLLSLAQSQGMGALAQDWSPHMVAPGQLHNHQLMQSIKSMVTNFSVEELEMQLTALLNRSDQSKYLKKIKHHVLLICGDKDSWSPVSQHQQIKEQLNNADLKVIKESGHMVMLEQPEILNKILVEWFRHP